ncbi:MAG: hypothetical protein ACRD8K_11655 [Nitrososphaeraceae archaeon]
MSLIKSTTYPIIRYSNYKKDKDERSQGMYVDNLFLSIPIFMQKEHLILNLKEDTKGLLLDGLGDV